MPTPKLRFKEFDDGLEKNNLIDLTMWASGGTPSKKNEDYWMGDIPLISGASMHTSKIYESEVNITDLGLKKGSKLAPKNSILILVRGSMLFKKIPMGMTLKDVAFNQDVKSIITKEDLNEYYFFQWLLSQENIIQNKVTSTGIGAGKLDTSELQNLEIYYPAKVEQTKIATFLSAVDTKIDELTQKHELLTEYKKGMMQQIFSQKLRFKADNGSDFEDWIKYNIGTIFTEIKDQVLDQDIETYSITAGKGFISQAEKFGRDISGKQNRKYIVLKPNDFSYNKGNSKTFKYGCVYLNRFNHNIAVPNVFISFRTKESNKHYSIFYAQLFESHYLDKHLRLLISSSARMDGLLNISKKGFFEIPIPSPCLEEQTKIANFLTAIDQKIDNVAEQIDHAKTWKKGLLQQMFV